MMRLLSERYTLEDSVLCPREGFDARALYSRIKFTYVHIYAVIVTDV
jgi:hypothetical protein